MDGTEPYTGYDDYDPGTSNSTMPEEAYTAGGLPRNNAGEKDTPPAPVAYIHDSRRQDELDLDGDGFSLPEKYTARRTSYGDIPLVPVPTDRRRVGIHPPCHCRTTTRHRQSTLGTVRL